MISVKKAFISFSSLFPLPGLLKFSGLKVLLPYHHVVSNDYLPHIKNLYDYKSTLAFEKDLDWLLKNFNPISAHDLYDHCFQNAPLPAGSFLLSFDDGFREVYDIIAPMLKKKGVPAIFFINPAFIDNKELFYRCKLSLVIEKLRGNPKLLSLFHSKYFPQAQRNFLSIRQSLLQLQYTDRKLADEWGAACEIDFDQYLEDQQPFMTSSQIKELSSQGFTIGAHSWDHPNYKFLSLNEQLEQTAASLHFISSFQDLKTFSFPHEDKNLTQSFFDEQKKKEDRILFFGVQNQKSETGNVVWHRFNAENPNLDLASLVKGMLVYNGMLRTAGRSAVSRSIT